MYETQSLLYVAAIALCLFSIGLLGGNQRRYSRYILALLAVEAVCFLLEWLMIHPHSLAKSLWLGSLMVLSFLPAPLLWLAYRELLTGERIRLKSLHKAHYAVLFAGFVLCLPLLASAHGGVGYVNSATETSTAHRLFIHGTMLACIVLFTLQVPYYLLRIYRRIEGHLDIQKKYHPEKEQASTGVIRFLIFVLCSAWLLGILRTVHCIVPGASSLLQLLFTCVDVGVTVGVLYVMVRHASTSYNKPDAATEGPAQYSKSPLTKETRERILQKLGRAMESEQLYCDNLLSLRTLSSHIKESPHYVSQVLSQELETNFYQFINRHRIEHAKRELLDNPQRNVLEIALDAGFNSKSTFNTAFRKITQTTPSQFRTQTT